MKRMKRAVLVLFSALIILFMTSDTSFLIFEKNDWKLQCINTKLEKISLLEIYIDDGKIKPMIILQHGFKNKKESVAELGKKLAQKGFFVIAPDAYAHGEREEASLSLVETIVNTSKEYEKIIDFYETDERADTSKLGMAGFSMGGCICFYYAVNGKHKPKVIAPTIATPYFEQFIGHKPGRSIYSSKEGLRLEEDSAKIELLNEYTKKSSPFNNYVNLDGIDMLIQNGGSDSYVTDEGVNKLKEVLNTDSAEVCFITVEGVKHQVTEEMRNNIVEFMSRNLI